MRLLSCRETALMISRGEYEEAVGWRRFLAWLHLLYCRHCRRYKRELAALAHAARLWAEGPIDPERQAAFEERLIRALAP